MGASPTKREATTIHPVEEGGHWFLVKTGVFSKGEKGYLGSNKNGRN